VRPAEHRHESQESPIGAAINADAFWIDPLILNQPGDTGLEIIQLWRSHPAIDRSPPCPSVTCGRAIVHIKYKITLLYQQAVEHEFMAVIGPAKMSVLKIPGAVDKHDGRTKAGGLGIPRCRIPGRSVEARIDDRTILPRDLHNLRLDPWPCQEFL